MNPGALAVTANTLGLVKKGMPLTAAEINDLKKAESE